LRDLYFVRIALFNGVDISVEKQVGVGAVGAFVEIAVFTHLESGCWTDGAIVETEPVETV